MTNNKHFENIRNIETTKYNIPFDITTILKDAVGAKSWKDKEGLWALLSSSTTDFSSKLFERINNYTKNLIDIDTCEPIALKSMASAVNLPQLTDFIKDIYPDFINNLINTFSIDYKLLLSPADFRFKTENNQKVLNLEIFEHGKFLSDEAIAKYFGTIDQRNKHTFPTETGYPILFYYEILKNLDKLEYLLETENNINLNQSIWSYIDDKNTLEALSLNTEYLFLNNFQKHKDPSLKMVFDELKFYKNLYNDDIIQNESKSIILNTDKNDYSSIEIVAIRNYYDNQLDKEIKYQFRKPKILERCSKIYTAKEFKEYRDYYKTFGLSQNDHLNSILYYWTPYDIEIINESDKYLLVNDYKFDSHTKIINPFLIIIAILKNIAYNTKTQELMKTSYIEKFSNVSVDLSDLILYAVETIQTNETSYYYNLMVFHFYGVLYDNIFNNYLKSEWNIVQNNSYTLTNFIGKYSEYTQEEFISLISNDILNDDLIEFIKTGPTIYNQYHVDFIKTISILNNIITYTDRNEYKRQELPYYIPYYNNNIDLFNNKTYLYDNNYYKYRQLLVGISYEYCECNKPIKSDINPNVCKTCGKVIYNNSTDQYYTYNVETSYIYKAALIFADYCLKIKQARQDIKASVQQYSRIGTAKLLNDLIYDYFYKQFSQRKTWSYNDSAAKYYDTLSTYNLYLDLLKLTENNLDISIIEYYDKTNYLNIYSTNIIKDNPISGNNTESIYIDNTITSLISSQITASIDITNEKYYYNDNKYLVGYETVSCFEPVSAIVDVPTMTSYVESAVITGYTHYISTISGLNTAYALSTLSECPVSSLKFPCPISTNISYIDGSTITSYFSLIALNLNEFKQKTHLFSIDSIEIYNSLKASYTDYFPYLSAVIFTDAIINYEMPEYGTALVTGTINIPSTSTIISSYTIELPTYAEYSETYKTINTAINNSNSNNNSYNGLTEDNIKNLSTTNSINLRYNAPFWDTTITGNIDQYTAEDILKQCHFFEQYLPELKNIISDYNKIEYYKKNIYPFLNIIWSVHANALYTDSLSDFMNYYSGNTGKLKIENLENSSFPTIAPFENINNLFSSDEINEYKSTYLAKTYYDTLNGLVSAIYTDFFNSTQIIETSIIKESNLYFNKVMLAVPTNGILTENTNFAGYMSIAEQTYKLSNNEIKNEVDGPWKYTFLQRFLQLYIDPSMTNLQDPISSYLTANYDFVMDNDVYNTFLQYFQFNIKELKTSETYLSTYNMYNISNDTYNTLYKFYDNFIQNTYNLLEFDYEKNKYNEINKLMIYSNQILKLKNYKITEYKKDIFDNHYFLFKHYAYDKYEDSGELWIRYKNRPLAMPFMKAIVFADASDSYYNITNIDLSKDFFLTEYDQVICTHNTYTKILKQIVNNLVNFEIYNDIFVLVGYTNFVKHSNIYENDLSYKYLKTVIFKIYELNDKLYIEPTSIKFLHTHETNDYLLNINEFIGTYQDKNKNIITVLYNINKNNTTIKDFKYKNNIIEDNNLFLLDIPLTFTYVEYNINNYLLTLNEITYQHMKYPIAGLYQDNICIDTQPYISNVSGYNLIIKSMDQSIWKIDKSESSFNIGYESVSNNVLIDKNASDYAELYTKLYNSDISYLDILKVKCSLIYKNISNILLPVINKITIALDTDSLNDNLEYTEISGSMIELNSIHQTYPKCDITENNELITKFIPTKFGGIKSYQDDITYDLNGQELLSSLIHCKALYNPKNGIKEAFAKSVSNINPDFKNGLYELITDLLNSDLLAKTNLKENELTINGILDKIYLNDPENQDGLVINLDMINNYNANSYKLTTDILKFLPGIANCILDDMKVIINFGELTKEIKEFMTGSESFDLDVSIYIDDTNINGAEHLKKVGWHCGYKYTDFINWDTGDNTTGGPEIFTISLKKYYNYLYNLYKDPNIYNRSIYLQKNLVNVLTDCKLVINVCWYNESRIISLNPNIEIIWNGIYYKHTISSKQMTFNIGCCENSFQEVLHLDLLNNSFKFTYPKCYKIETIYDRITDTAKYTYQQEYYTDINSLLNTAKHLTSNTSTVVETDSYIEVCSNHGYNNDTYVRTWYIYDINKLISNIQNIKISDHEIIEYFEKCLLYYVQENDTNKSYYKTIFTSNMLDVYLSGIIDDLYIRKDNYQLGYYFDNYLELTQEYPSGNIFANIPNVITQFDWTSIPLYVYNNQMNVSTILAESNLSTLIFKVENKLNNSPYYNEHIVTRLSTVIPDLLLAQSISNTIGNTKTGNLSGELSLTGDIYSDDFKNKAFKISLIPYYELYINTLYAKQFILDKQYLTDLIYNFTWVNYPDLLTANFNLYNNIRCSITGNNIDIYKTYFIGDQISIDFNGILNTNLRDKDNLELSDEISSAYIYYSNKDLALLSSINTNNGYITTNNEMYYKMDIQLYSVSPENIFVYAGIIHYNIHYKNINIVENNTNKAKYILLANKENDKIIQNYTISIDEKIVNSFNTSSNIADWRFSKYNLSVNLDPLTTVISSILL